MPDVEFSAMDLPTFDEPTVTYGFTDFGGNLRILLLTRRSSNFCMETEKNCRR